jgi:hypothetical protein
MAEPVFLGTQQDLLNADDERALQEMKLLAVVLGKVGYRLASGPEPHIEELWAMPVEQSSVTADVEPPPEDPADAFERKFLAWVSIYHGRLPEERAGTNAYYWELPFFDSKVTFVIIGHGKNSSVPPAGEDWVLKIDEAEPAPFIKSVEPHFEKASNRKVSGGRVRVQFRSSKLIRPFEDQTDHT